MKKLLILLFAVSSIASLTACSNEETPETPNTEETTPEVTNNTPKTIEELVDKLHVQEYNFNFTLQKTDTLYYNYSLESNNKTYVEVVSSVDNTVLLMLYLIDTTSYEKALYGDWVKSTDEELDISFELEGLTSSDFELTNGSYVGVNNEDYPTTITFNSDSVEMVVLYGSEQVTFVFSDFGNVEVTLPDELLSL